MELACCLQEQGADRLVLHPRDTQGTVRREDDRRKRARERQASHQAERASRQAEEVKRLKRLKRAELDEQYAPTFRWWNLLQCWACFVFWVKMESLSLVSRVPQGLSCCRVHAAHQAEEVKRLGQAELEEQ